MLAFSLECVFFLEAFHHQRSSSVDASGSTMCLHASLPLTPIQPAPQSGSKVRFGDVSTLLPLLHFVALVFFIISVLCAHLKGWHWCDVNEPNSPRRPIFVCRLTLCIKWNKQITRQQSCAAAYMARPRRFSSSFTPHLTKMLLFLHVTCCSWHIKSYFSIAALSAPFAIVDLLHFSASARGYVMRLVARGCADTRDRCSALRVNAKKENLGL